MAAAPATPRLVLFSGMGADARMYARLARLIPDLVVAPWLRPPVAPSLEAYARDYLERGVVSSGDCIGGSSFGGMLALEIARHAPMRGVALLGSCRDVHAIPAYVRALAPLARMLPNRAFRLPDAAIPLLWLKMGLRHRAERTCFATMLRSMPPQFIRWCCHAALVWPGVSEPGCPVLHLHGSDDHIMPPGRVHPDQVLAGAGHVVAMTHAPQVAAAMVTWLRSLPADAATVRGATT